MKKTLKVAAAALTMAAGFATTSANAVEITWGNLTGFTDGDTTATFDFGGLGTVGMSLDLVSPAISQAPFASTSLSTDHPGLQTEDHAGYTNVSGDVFFVSTDTNFRHNITVNWDFSGYTGLPDSLVFSFDNFSGVAEANNQNSVITVNSPGTLLGDINNAANVSNPLGQTIIGVKDVPVANPFGPTNVGDFLFGEFAFDTNFSTQLTVRGGDSFGLGLGTVPVPVPASALLLAAGLAFGRRKFAKRAA